MLLALTWVPSRYHILTTHQPRYLGRRGCCSCWTAALCRFRRSWCNGIYSCHLQLRSSEGMGVTWYTLADIAFPKKDAAGVLEPKSSVGTVWYFWETSGFGMFLWQCIAMVTYGCLCSSNYLRCQWEFSPRKSSQSKAKLGSSGKAARDDQLQPWFTAEDAKNKAKLGTCIIKTT